MLYAYGRFYSRAGDRTVDTYLSEEQIREMCRIIFGAADLEEGIENFQETLAEGCVMDMWLAFDGLCQLIRDADPMDSSENEDPADSILIGGFHVEDEEWVIGYGPTKESAIAAVAHAL